MHAHATGCGCEPDAGDGERFSLYRFINTGGVRGYNEHVAGSAVLPFKPESQKRDRTKYAETDQDDDDDETRMILFVPFTGTVRLRRVVIVAEGGATVDIYKNTDVDLDTVERATATQRFAVVPNDDGALELTVVAPKFNDVRSLSFCFAEPVRVFYIGLLGEWIKPTAAPLGVVYESAPQMADHRTRADQQASTRLI